MNAKLQIFVSIILWLIVKTAAQFPISGQYAFPQMSAPMSGAMPGGIPGAMQLQMPPGAMPMGPHSMNLNAPFQVPQQRLPVVVMPYHSKASDRKYRKRKRIKKKHSSSSSSSSESASSSRENLRSKKKNRKRKQKRQVLTPVISYVTRNGDIVYQKKVKKDKAGDWLDIGKTKSPRTVEESREENIDSQEITMRDLKHKFNLTSKKRKHRH